MVILVGYLVNINYKNLIMNINMEIDLSIKKKKKRSTILRSFDKLKSA